MAHRSKKTGKFVKGSGKKHRKAHKTVKHHKAHKASALPLIRKRHRVKRHRKVWTAHKRKSMWMSNPPIVGDITNGLIMAGVLFGTLFVVGIVNRQAEKLPLPATRFTPLLTKLGVALLAVWGVRQLARNGIIRGPSVVVAQAATFVPVAFATLATFAPAIAAQVPGLTAELQGYMPQDLGMAMAGRNRLSDNTISAELAAEYESESESGAF